MVSEYQPFLPKIRMSDLRYTPFPRAVFWNVSGQKRASLPSGAGPE
jgi:hypothetical protein